VKEVDRVKESKRKDRLRRLDWKANPELREGHRRREQQRREQLRKLQQTSEQKKSRKETGKEEDGREGS
jgi:hypothetical protein